MHNFCSLFSTMNLNIIVTALLIISVAAEQVDRVPAKNGTQENTSLESLNVETCSKKVRTVAL